MNGDTTPAGSAGSEAGAPPLLALRAALIVAGLVLLLLLPLLWLVPEPGVAPVLRPRLIMFGLVVLAAAAAAYASERWRLRSVRAGGLAALAMFALATPILAILTDQSRGTNLDLVPRFNLLAVLCVGAFAIGALGDLRRRIGRERFFANQNIGAAAAIVASAAIVVGLMVGWRVGLALLAVALLLLAIITTRASVERVPGVGAALTDLAEAVKVGARQALPTALLGFAIVFPLVAVQLSGWAGALKWIDNFGIQILIYVMLGWGLNVVVGFAGLLDLGYVAFYAVGAYSYSLLAREFGLSFWMLLPLAGILAAFWGVLLGFPVLRLRGDYLAIVTLAFGEIIRLVLVNWQSVTGGTAGIISIPRPSFFGIPFTEEGGFSEFFGIPFSPLYRTIFLYYLILALSLLTAYVTIRLRRLPIGRAWEALREDEIACRSLGIDTVVTKLTAFAIGAMFAGFAGSFFAARQGFINPESFTFIESAQVLAIVVLGGAGSLFGVVIASILLVGGFELLRELDFLKEIFGRDFDPTQYRALIFGLAMVLVMIWRPRGLISTRDPTVFLKQRRTIGIENIKEGHG